MTSRDGSPEASAPGSIPEADLSRVRTVPVGARPNKVRAEQFAAPPPPDPAARTFGAFLGSLPRILQAEAFLQVADAIATAVERRRAVVWMLGGHVVKTGLGPLLIDLVRRGAATHLASNGSAAIHDYEMARWGGTSEDVEAGLADGSFGMAEETGRDMNEAISRGSREGWGMGESLARDLAGRGDLAYPGLSLLLQSHRLGVPYTLHPALGAEIIHQHPAADGAALGDTGHRDFRRLSAALLGLDDGGVVVNFGSAVVMPEVFLKALTVARNLHGGRPRAFTAVDFDMLRHYRPRVNVVERPTRSGGGRGFHVTGHHELLLPLLAWTLAERLPAVRAGRAVEVLVEPELEGVTAALEGEGVVVVEALAEDFDGLWRGARQHFAYPDDDPRGRHVLAFETEVEGLGWFKYLVNTAVHRYEPRATEAQVREAVRAWHGAGSPRRYTADAASTFPGADPATSP